MSAKPSPFHFCSNKAGSGSFSYKMAKHSFTPRIQTGCLWHKFVHSGMHVTYTQAHTHIKITSWHTAFGRSSFLSLQLIWRGDVWGENAFSSLMNALGKQPLSRLALGYNTLGLQVGVLNNESKQEATCRIIETTLFIIGENKFAPSDVWWILQRLRCLKSDSFCGLCHLVHSQGLGSILNAASQHLTWASTLSSLSLEMNGFGDEGCLKLVQSYLVAGIVSYFFHTNMFAPSFAMLCHHSCILHMEYSAQLVRMFSDVYFVHEIRYYDLYSIIFTTGPAWVGAEVNAFYPGSACWSWAGTRSRTEAPRCIGESLPM